eukprot:1306280-Rhodomonas_salina.3
MAYGAMAVRYGPTIVLCDCPVLTKRMLPSAYELATRCPLLKYRICYAKTGPGVQCFNEVPSPICLRACYAMSCTGHSV